MDERRLLGAIKRARKTMPLTAALRVLRSSSSRYYAWVNANDACTLDDRPSCPRSKVQRLTLDEVQAIGDMVGKLVGSLWRMWCDGSHYQPQLAASPLQPN